MSIREFVIPAAKTVQVEAFGTTVTIGEMGALDRIEYLDYLEKLQKSDTSEQRAGVLLAAFTLVKCLLEDGKRVFADNEVEEVASGVIGFDDLQKVFEAAATLNRIYVDDQKAVEGN